MRDAHDHDAISAGAARIPPRKRPVWPEDLEADTAAPNLPEMPDEGFLTLAEVERQREAIAAELSRRETDLEERERAVAEQAAALARDERNQRLEEQRIAKQQQAHESKANAIRAELGDRLNRCEELILALEREQADLKAEREEIGSQQAAVRDLVLEELAVERQKFDAERDAFQAEKQEFRRRIEAREQEASTAQESLRASWETERESLRKQLTEKLAAELSEERRAFDAERFHWEQERGRELAALEEERAKHEELLAGAQSNLDEIRLGQEREFQQRRHALEAEIASKVEELEARLAEQQSGWESTRSGAEGELQALREELEAQRLAQEQALEAARAEFEQARELQNRRLEEDAHARLTAFEQERAAWIAERDAAQARLEGEAAALEELQQAFDQQCEQRQTTLDAEIRELRAEAERELAAGRQAFEKECESIRRALDEERAVMENRLHFQSDHLDRTRDGLEEARREVELRLQQAHARAVALGETNRLRKRQLDRYRELLDQKEKSLARERRLLAEIRQQLETERAEDARQRDQTRQTALATRDSENLAEKELRDDLAGRSKQLAERQARLDTLRIEIESTHRENLELRVALDEAWARLTQTAGPETARKELQVSRDVVAEYFRNKEIELDRRQALLTAESAAARQQVAQMESRRKELTDWLNGSLATLRRKEEDLHRWVERLETRDTRTQGLTDRWRNERLEAEQIIRDLLEQLAEATNDNPRLTHDPTISIPHRVAG